MLASGLLLFEAVGALALAVALLAVGEGWSVQGYGVALLGCDYYFPANCGDVLHHADGV